MAVSQVGSTTTSYYVTNGANSASTSSMTSTSSATSVSSTTLKVGSASTTSSATAISSATLYASATAKTTCSTTVTYSGASSTAKVSSTTVAIVQATAINKTGASASTTASMTIPVSILTSPSNRQNSVSIFVDAIQKITDSFPLEPFVSHINKVIERLTEMQEKEITLSEDIRSTGYELEYTRAINGIGIKKDGTIIMGNNATMDDAYTIVLLDKWHKQGVEKNKINEFIDAYIESKNAKGEETVISKGKDIEYYSEFEDITERLLSEMIKNEYEDIMFHTDNGLMGVNEIPFNWVNYLMEFKKNVGNDGIWDLKQKEEWNNSSLYYFDGVLVDKDAPGNIMYGYLGKAYGIPDDILYAAAGYAQLSAGTSKTEFAFTFFDDPMDQNNIRIGIELYNRIHK